MATERIEIIVTERGTREVNRRIAATGTTATAASRGVALLRRSILALGGIALIRGLVRTADTFTLIQNRLKVVTRGTRDLNTVTEELFGIAQRTRASFKATAEVYARAARSVETLGISQKETLEFTETLNKAVILSGASTAEAAGGLIQLSQALASSRLSGDEFRSVSEQLPVVLKIIANELGVNIGQLRKMGQAGELTADVILRAFRNAKEEIGVEFAKTIPTIAQSFQILGNAVIKFIGRMNEGTGIGEAFSRIIIGLAENFDVFARSVLVLTTLLGVAFAQTAINAAIRGLQALRVALIATGIGAVPIILATIVTNLVFFSDKILIASDSTATLADVATVAFKRIKEALAQIWESLQPALAIVKGFLSQWVDEFDFTFEKIVLLAAFGIDKLLGVFSGLIAAGKTAFDNLGKVITFGFIKAIEKALNGGVDKINEFINDYNRLDVFDVVPDLPFLDRLTIDMPNEVDAAMGKVKKSYKDAVDVFGSPVEDYTKGFFKEVKDLAKTNADNKGGGASGDVTNNTPSFGQGIQQALKAADDSRVTRRKSGQSDIDLGLQLLQDIRGPQELFIEQQEVVGKLFENNLISAGQYGIAMANLRAETLEFGTTAADGFHRGMARIKADILDVASVAENALTNAFGAAEDAFVSFVQTGKFDFSGLVDSILADLTKLLARQAISGLINSFAGGGAGGAGGGVVGILGSLFGGARAAGGPVSPDKAFLVGEKGPELFTPPSRGNITPNSDLRGAAMAPPVVNVNVINVTDPNEIAAAINDGSADKAIINAVGRNKSAVKQNLES